MKRHRSEELLWELARLEEADEGSGDRDGETPGAETGLPDPGLADPGLPDAVLDAYRQGALSEEEELRVERRLSRSPGSRERLAFLAGVSPAALSASARERFLHASETSTEVPPAAAVTPRRAPVWWLAAAAAIVILAGSFWWWRVSPATQSASLPGLEASIHGLALVRNGEGETSHARSTTTTAEPSTAVTVGIDVHPPRAGLAAGLYVFQPQRRAVVRLPLEATWPSRGTARFRAPARTLVGAEPGVYRLFAVIARAGSLPPDRILAAGEDAMAAFAGRDVKVEPLRLEIVQRAVPELPGDRPLREGNGP